MQVIPVIDLRAGRVVRAVAGRRDEYKPSSSPLCPSADPLDVVAALRRVRPFELFYLADLDAILGSGDNRAAITELLAAFPSTGYWLDAGFNEPRRALSWPLGRRLRPVLGSESQSGIDDYKTLYQALRAHRPVLSLDYRDDRFLGPEELLKRSEDWPDEVILMRLDRVGVGAGPDATLPAKVDGRRWYAAGGVRDAADVRRLAGQGFAGVLVASALHEMRL
jgi:phosphoribosylformimino-5-aminoimidazole carboxamide ribotide isomerase